MGRKMDEAEHSRSARNVFADLKNEIEQASNRYILSEIYTRAAYLISLTYTPQWESRVGKDVEKARASVINEFKSVARAINLKARNLGFCTHYDEEWRFSKSPIKKGVEKSAQLELGARLDKKSDKESERKKVQLPSESAD